MGKIWLKSVDPSRQCCGCEGKTGPCSTCCSGILIDYSQFSANTNFDYKECIFFSDRTDVITKTNLFWEISSSSGTISYDSIDHSISIPSGTELKITTTSQLVLENVPITLGTSISNPSARFSNSNLATEQYSSLAGSFSINELNNKKNWFEYSNTGENWAYINVPSDKSSVEGGLKSFSHFKILASGEYGLFNSSVSFINFPTVGVSQLSPDNLEYNNAFLLPKQIGSYEQSDPLDCSSFEYNGRSTGALYYKIMDPQQSPLNSIFNFNTIELNVPQTIYYVPFNGSLLRFDGSTLEKSGDGMKRVKVEGNAQALTALNTLPYYGKLIVGQKQYSFPDYAIGVDCVPESFVNVSDAPANGEVNGSVILKFWYPTQWPLFNLTSGISESITLTTNQNVCLGIHQTPGNKQTNSRNGKNFFGTGWAPSIETGNYSYVVTGELVNTYKGESLTSNKSIQYNRLYIYSSNTANKLSCVNGVVS